jgi:GNAT superfamily N-acetyltransferase
MILRSATLDDIPEVSRVYVQAWRETYRGLAPDAFTDGLTEEAAAGVFRESLKSDSFAYFLKIALLDGKIVGFTDGGKERSHPEQGLGEIYGLYILKDHQRGGIGRALFHTAVRCLLDAGLSPMIVWVLDHSPSRKFYEASGGRLAEGVKRLEVGGEKLTLVSYQWDSLDRVLSPRS